MTTSISKRSARRSNVCALVPKSTPTSDQIGLVDQIDWQILFARGIEFAVLGVASIEHFDASEIQALIDTHIKRLRAIRDQTERAFGVNQAFSPTGRLS